MAGEEMNELLKKVFNVSEVDFETIDAFGLWDAVRRRLPERYFIPLFLRLEERKTFREIGKELGVSVNQASIRYRSAERKLLHPAVIRDIRNSVMGWPNFLRIL